MYRLNSALGMVISTSGFDNIRIVLYFSNWYQNVDIKYSVHNAIL